MEGTQPRTAPVPESSRLPRAGRRFTILAVLVGVVALVVVLATLPRAPTAPAAGGSLGFGTSASEEFGNASSGWTYVFPVYVDLSLEHPRPIVWGNLNVWLLNATNGMPLSFPAGTTLRALSPANATIGEYDFTEALWRTGFFALVAEGQTLVLHGRMPPGVISSNGTVGFSLCIGYANGGQSWTDYLFLARG